ncbi:MAG: putative glycosyltransferase EpsJ [Syntrophomonadaceae bacterium]|nr:putative glycosyltransferase EpsJ [Bacillota bacterium]
MSFEPLVSVIVPTYNEEADIRSTIDALLALDYEKKEIIVVDSASTDKTVEILKEYEKGNQIILYLESSRCGVSSARNLGIREANGEIVIILNADVILPSDFIRRILTHYEKGADFVLVESRVENINHVFPQWIQAQHLLFYQDRNDILWTEGFSCRKGAAIDVGLFPEALAANTAGEDAVFGERLNKKYKKVIDRTIVVTHVAPEKFIAFWRQRVGRGRGTSYKMFYINKIPLRALFSYLVGDLSLFFLQTILVFPVLLKAIALARLTDSKIKNAFYFFFVTILDSLAQLIGEWQAYRELARSEKEQKQRVKM